MDFELKNKLVLTGTLIWSLNVESTTLDIIRFNSDHSNVPSSNFKKFPSLIKSCFRNYFSETFKNFEVFLNDTSINRQSSNYYMEMVLPINLNYTGFTYCLLKIIPKTIEDKVKDFAFVLTPIKEYNNEAINMHICNNKKKCDKATRFVKNRILMNSLFTNWQEKVLFYLLKEEGISTTHIASFFNKDVIKINICIELIKNRLSNFFDINFTSIDQAISYYEKCFDKIILKNE